MERNDTTIPAVSLIVAAIFWVILLFLFNSTLKSHHGAAEGAAEAPAAATATASDWKTGGQAVYTANCAGCHGANGEGGFGKAFTNNTFVTGDPAAVINVIQKGKGGMPAFPQLNETQLLDVVNFIRNSWGNKADIVTPEIFAAKGDEEAKLAALNRSRFVPDHLGLPEIFLTTFIIILTIYGLIGLYSAWAEGETLKPGLHIVRSNNLAFGGIVLSMVGVLWFGYLFVKQIVMGIQGSEAEKMQPINVTAEGTYAAMVLLLLATALMLYKKYFMDGEALVEDASGEFPW